MANARLPHLKFSLTVGAGLTALVAAFLVFLTREPEFDGRNLMQWLEIGTTNFAAASNTLARIGTNSLPFVLKWTGAEPEPANRKPPGYLLKLPRPIRAKSMGYWMSHDDTERRAALARVALRALQGKACSIVPELKAMTYKKPPSPVPWRAIQALGAMGTNSFPVLLDILREPDHPCRAGAATIIGDMLQKYPSLGAVADPVLAKCLNETDTLLVMRASSAVDHDHANLALVIPPLIRNLTNDDVLIRLSATNALSDLAPQCLAAPQGGR